ncbi:MAG: helix-turn-helix domain-containing protein [Candidatus Marinimicrobia bacterium]|nr:helix-turn-helix domain-containing protein [Candidatus Neomarinimicrobiota bacterium]MDD5583068.1 helix-turn-helix domain-containing protein [Candidatus Neomarinimicrobiota bacterium]
MIPQEKLILTMNEELIKKMNTLGFTIYESKAYLALLKISPASGYEVAQESGVPRSVIYDILRKLERSGIIGIVHDKPKKYVPLPPDQLISMLNNQFYSNIECLKRDLEKFSTGGNSGHLWNINGYDTIMQKARELIKKAKKSVYISAWESEIEFLKQDIKDALKRDVKVIIFSFNPLPMKHTNFYSYAIDEHLLEQNWNHKIVVVADKEEVLMGGSDKRFPQRGAWTDNEAIITIATNYIILDITLLGQRRHINVSEAVTHMMNGHLNGLDELLKEVNP